jgi:hypothetical protein
MDTDSETKAFMSDRLNGMLSAILANDFRGRLSSGVQALVFLPAWSTKGRSGLVGKGTCTSVGGEYAVQWLWQGTWSFVIASSYPADYIGDVCSIIGLGDRRHIL